jgi:hypothetical protein
VGCEGGGRGCTKGPTFAGVTNGPNFSEKKKGCDKSQAPPPVPLSPLLVRDSP